MSLAVPQHVIDTLARLEVGLDGGVLSLLSRYLDLLLETNQQFNLTAVRDREQAWGRHIVDSLTLLPLLADVPPESKMIDVGSGGGLPGVPLAAARPDLVVTLLEATGKKARFLERCVGELPLANVRVVNRRAEDAGRDKTHRQRYDLAVCRAVGPLRELLEYTLPLVRVGGQVLAMKGARVEEELDAAGDALHLLGAGELAVIEAYPQGEGIEGVIVAIEKARATPMMYPRPAGTPGHAPL